LKHVGSVGGAVRTTDLRGSTPLLAASGVDRLEAANLHVNDNCEDK
jgi:hypothetical protein